MYRAAKDTTLENHSEMWPFSSGGKAEDPDNVTEDISPSLQQFFEKQDRSARGLKLEKPDITGPVPQAPASTLSDINFVQFKQDTRKVAAINCAEIQQAALECYKGWKFLSGTECSTAMTRSTRCMAIQQNALKRLRYEECSSRDQCQQIRALVDELFTRNYGQFGENINEETQKCFEYDLGRTLSFLWDNK